MSLKEHKFMMSQSGIDWWYCQ